MVARVRSGSINGCVGGGPCFFSDPSGRGGGGVDVLLARHTAGTENADGTREQATSLSTLGAAGTRSAAFVTVLETARIKYAIVCLDSTAWDTKTKLVRAHP